MFFDIEGGGRRLKKVDGYAVYSLRDLGISTESGGTDLCPFDCQCCY